MSKGHLIWGKLDPGFFTNRKVIRAGRNGRDVFLFALCQNAARGAAGWIPADDLEPEYVAGQLRVSEADARDGVTRSVTAGLLRIDGDRVVILGWDDEWARRPLTNAERQANLRKRREGVTETALPSNDDITRNGSERSERSERGARYAPDPLSVLESDSDSRQAADTKPQRTRRRPEAAQQLESTWEPSAAMIAVAHSLGVNFDHELVQFRLNARARGHAFHDPEAAFEAFMRKSHDVGKQPNAKPKPGATTTTKRVTVVLDGVPFDLDDDGEPIPVARETSAQSKDGTATTATTATTTRGTSLGP